MLKYLPQALLSIVILRLAAAGATLGDSICALSICSLIAFYKYQEDKKETSINKETIDRIVSLEEMVVETKNKVSSIQLGAGLRR